MHALITCLELGADLAAVQAELPSSHWSLLICSGNCRKLNGPTPRPNLHPIRLLRPPTCRNPQQLNPYACANIFENYSVNNSMLGSTLTSANSHLNTVKNRRSKVVNSNAPSSPGIRLSMVVAVVTGSEQKVSSAGLSWMESFCLNREGRLQYINCST